MARLIPASNSEEAAVTPGDEIHAALTEIFHAVFGRDDLTLTPALTAKDVPGWDSFKQVDIILAIEERYSIQLNSQEMDSLGNVGDLLNVVTLKTMPINHA
jgi:acyl carrier protein